MSSDRYNYLKIKWTIRRYCQYREPQRNYKYMSKYQVTRIMSVLQATSVNANSAEEAIEASRKFKQSQWATIDNKRRKNYKATKIEYAG